MRILEKTQRKYAKKVESTSSEEVSSSEEQIKQKAKVAVQPKFRLAVSNQSKKMETIDDSDEDSSDESDSEKEICVQNPSKEEESSEESLSDTEERLKKKIKIAQDAKNAGRSSSDEESDSPEELPSKHVKKSDTDAKMADVPSSSLAKKLPSKNPITFKATGTKTLFMGTLSDSIEKNDVINFYKDAVKLLKSAFPFERTNLQAMDTLNLLQWKRLKRTAYIDFADRNGFYQALKLDGSYIKGRTIRVDDARPITDSLGDENDESTDGFDGGRVRESGRFGSGNYFGGRYSGVNIGEWIGGRCGKDNVGNLFGGRRPYPGARCGSDYARKYCEINRPSVAPRGAGKKTVIDK